MLWSRAQAASVLGRDREAAFDDGACAFVLAPDRSWRILTSTGVVLNNRETIHRLDDRPLAAAFSPAGDTLALVTRKAVGRVRLR